MAASNYISDSNQEWVKKDGRMELEGLSIEDLDEYERLRQMRRAEADTMGEIREATRDFMERLADIAPELDQHNVDIGDALLRVVSFRCEIAAKHNALEERLHEIKDGNTDEFTKTLLEQVKGLEDGFEQEEKLLEELVQAFNEAAYGYTIIRQPAWSPGLVQTHARGRMRGQPRICQPEGSGRPRVCQGDGRPGRPADGRYLDCWGR